MNLQKAVQRAPYRKASSAHDRAQNLVEFALTLPLLLLVFFGIMEFGLIVFSYNTIANAAREGTRYGIIDPGPESGDCAAPTGAIGNQICQMVSGLDTAHIAYQAGVSAQSITVAITYTYQFITAPVMDAAGLGPTIDLTTVATMQVE